MDASSTDPTGGRSKSDTDSSDLGATVRLPSDIKADVSDRKSETRLPVEAPAQFGKYEILGEIARGGMGIVYKARQADLDRIVALKVLQLDEGIDGSASQKDNTKELIVRFTREAQAVAKLEHPNIVKIHEVGVLDGRHFFTMEYIEGGNLRDHLARVDKESAERGAQVHPGVAVKRVLTIMRSVCEAIHHAHENGVVHRDIKPQNILIDAHGRPKVTDFGLAKSSDSQTHLTQSGAVMGTPAYMPPEQARGLTREIDRRSDVYSLGAVLYESLTGRTPFDAPTVYEIIHKLTTQEAPRPTFLNGRIHRDVETIVLKALEKEKDRRYQTAQEMAEDIRRFLEGEPIRARPASWGYRAWKKVRRHWVAFSAVAVALAAIGGFGTYAAVAAIQQAHEHDQQEARDKRGREAAALCDRAQRQEGQEAIETLTQAILTDPYCVDAYVARAGLFAKAGKAEAAVDDLSRAIDLAPDRANARVERARLYEGTLSDLSAALADWREVMRLDPKDAEACLAAGRILSAKGQHEQAAVVLDQAIRIDPSAKNYSARARQKLAAGKTQEASADFSEALQRDMGDADAHSGLGTCRRILGNLDAAVHEHDLAIQADPKTGRYRFEKGEDLLFRREYEHAIECYLDAVARDPDFAPAYARLGRVYVILGRYEAASNYAMTAIVLESRNAEAYLDLGRALSAKGSDELALHDFDRSIQLDPERAEAYLWRGKTLLRLKRFEDAVATLGNAIRKEKLSVEAWLTRARAYAELKKFAEALSDTSEALRLAPDSADAYVTRGWVHQKEGKPREALEDFGAALSKDKTNLEARIEMARARAALGDPASAVLEYTTAIAQLGDMPAETDAPLFRERAVARLAVGDAANARQDLARAASLSPRLTNDAAFVLLCGRVDSALHAWDKAVEDFTQVLRLGQAPSAELYHLRGTAWLWLEKWDLAERDLKEALSIDRKNAEAQAELAFLYLRQDQAERAEQAAEAAIALDPKDARAYFFRGEARWALGKIDLAIADERIAIENAPVFPEAMHSLGLLYLKQGKMDAAVQYLDTAIKQRKDYTAAYLDRGAVLERLGRTVEAIADYTQAIKLEPDDPDGWLRRGRAQILLGKVEQAIEDLTRCLDKDSHRADALFARGKAYHARGFLDRALTDLDAAVKLAPQDPDGYLERGRVQIDRKQYDAAMNDLSVAILLAPDRGEAYVERGRAAHEAGKEAQAIEDLTKALLIAPRDTTALYWRSRARLDSNDAEHALSDAEAGLKIDGKDVRLHLARGMALDASGAEDEAIEEYKKAVDLDPKGVESRRQLADAYVKAKRDREALEQLSRAIELAQGDAELRVLRGNVYFRMTMTKEAIDDYTAALKIDPRQTSALANRAYVYERLTEYEKAIADLTRLLTVEPNHPQAERLQEQLAEAQRRVKILAEGPKTPEEFFLHGDILLRRRELDASTADFERFLAGCGEPPAKGLEAMYVAAHYNLAAYYSHRKKLDAAFDHIEKAILGGFKDMPRLQGDHDLDELRSDARFQELIRPKGPHGPDGAR